MTPSFPPGLALAGLVAFAGCVLEEVALDGRPCPCVEGYVCDPTTQRCVGVGRSPVDAGASEDAGAPEPCLADGQCGSEQVCVSGFCSRPCGAPEAAPCADPRVCDPTSGHCISPLACTSPSDCAPPASTCIAGRCRPGCTTRAAPCRLDQTCDAVSGACVGSAACTTDDECPAVEWCDGRSCRQRCDAPGAPPCRGDAACDAESGRCAGGAELGEPCGSDRACASGQCLGARIGTSAPFQMCSRTCGATRECPLGFTCTPVSSAGWCLPGRLLGGMPALDLRSGTSCEVAENRCQSLFCEGSRCTERCSRDADCAPFGGRCVAVPQELTGGRRLVLPRCVAPFVGRPVGEPCESNLECAEGLCDEEVGRCARLCCAESDCGGNESCVPTPVDASVVRVCRVRTSSGAQVLGAPCQLNRDCESELCAPTEPTNPNGPRVCSTYCCSEADCAPLAERGRCVAMPGPIDDAFTPRCVAL